MGSGTHKKYVTLLNRSESYVADKVSKINLKTAQSRIVEREAIIQADKSHIPTRASFRSNRSVRKSSPASERVRKPSGGEGASHPWVPASESNIEDVFTFGDKP
eukprot:73439_1